jgi:hypothetical protein
MEKIINNTLPFGRCEYCIFRIAKFKIIENNKLICYKCIRNDLFFTKIFKTHFLKEINY